MAGRYHPTSPVLILTVETNHKTTEQESGDYHPRDGFRCSGIDEEAARVLISNRREIFRLLKEDQVRWPDDENEVFLNQSLRDGKDFSGTDETARYLPAVSRMTGGVFGAMEERGRADLLRSSHHLLVLSSAYGLLTPFEPVQFYRCQFGDYNLAYETWTRDDQVSLLLAGYISRHGIRRVFDFPYCSTLAYHECINWPLVMQTTGAEVFHGYHRWGKGDAALDFFGVFIRNHMLSAPARDLLELGAGTWHHDHIFTIERKQFTKNGTGAGDEFAGVLAGETATVEFKARALWSLDPPDLARTTPLSPAQVKYGAKASRLIIARTLAAFLNTDGGHLVIGVLETKAAGQEDQIVGIERDYPYLEDRDTDGYQRMVIDSVLKPFLDSDFFPHFSQFITVDFKKVQGKTLCWIRVKRSDTPVFVIFAREEMFFIRTGPETRELRGKREVLNYIARHFKS